MEFIEAETQESEHRDQKTEELVNNFEDQVGKVYSNIESQTVSGWNTFSEYLSNFQKKLPDLLTDTKEITKKIDLQNRINATKENFEKNLAKVQSKLNEEELKEIKENSAKLLQSFNENTNKYLDGLDQDLEKLENLTLGYATKLGSLLADKTGIRFGSEEVSGAKKDEIMFNMPQNLATSRLEAQLHELENNKDLYLTNWNSESVKDYVLTAEDEAEKKLLAAKESLKKLIDQLVPDQIDEQVFWKTYFSSKAKILEEEKKRKEILQQKPADDDEDFDWDDDEEEDKKEDDNKE
ncbi:hypothetical protein KL918_001618 [Ogataea parapolymorpha]|uniref:BSD domain-containing protein n=1 Tax=Ogataea parapolymorpha (strain ATCC 26012 / BCRC 20466 / JCM 22074 / NRRL Y-7560 / DL-1) TaxID=871575 RepID=W1QGJ6_OGAPD|nr:hypothetical protein HPODL_03340 [Ogataea parapolymorpha DL-1]ESW99450.1 hypothetical protein HPODL_03340 [Ogataea parapolymorpha DL-1]KAG7868975.1 hypothetical protein KL918_001618 [Ogataea parapolymorpha]KAG7874056.1 hypothetical protein KL916_001830 [Ogataea parapolymorpha]